MQNQSRRHERIFPLLPWPYEADRFPDNLAAIVHRAVGDGRSPARYVLHDADGYWHISDGSANLTIDDMVLDAIWHTIDHNAAVAGLADLPPGWTAIDEHARGQWERFPAASS